MRTNSAFAASVWIPIVALVLLWALRDVVVLVAYAVLLAYALLPVVKTVQRIRFPAQRTMSRKFAAAVIMLALVLAACWIAAETIPRLAAEAERFASTAPAAASRILETLQAEAAQRGLGVDSALDSIRSHAGEWLERIAGSLTGVIGGMFGGVARVLTFALVPLLTFYLLADSSAIEASALRFIPDQPRATSMRLRGAVDRALSSYVRGQAIVCLVMGGAVGIGLAIIRHPAALLLAVLVGAAEIIPYLGFTVAAIAVVLAGWTVSPLQALLGLGLYILINWAVGTFVTPSVMGRHLEMHPFLVTVSVIAGAQLMGPAGALLALPAAATLQAVVAELAGTSAPATTTTEQEASDVDAV
jgi:predicted PurR-regulated permease PerM